MGTGRDGRPDSRVAEEAAEKARLDALSYCGRRESAVKCWSQRAMRWRTVCFASDGHGRNVADGVPSFLLWRLGELLATSVGKTSLRILLHWLVHFQPLLALLGDKKVHPHVVELLARGNLRSMVGAERDVQYGESLEISLRLVGDNGDVVVR